MNKTNQKLVPEYGATFSPRSTSEFVPSSLPSFAVPAKRTAVEVSGSVLVRGKYQSQPSGRVDVLVSMDPAALERKVAMRWAQKGLEQSTSDPAIDSLFGKLS